MSGIGTNLEGLVLGEGSGLGLGGGGEPVERRGRQKTRMNQPRTLGPNFEHWRANSQRGECTSDGQGGLSALGGSMPRMARDSA